MTRRIQRKMEWTAEDRARHQATREKFKNRPTIQELVDSGEYGDFMPMGIFLQLKQALHQLKAEREKAGLSLADVAERTGMDKAVLSRLETGKQPNPTIATLARYAQALGKEMVVAFREAAPNG